MPVAHGKGHAAPLEKPLPVTVIVVAVGLFACSKVAAFALVEPATPGSLTVVLEPRRNLMSAPPAGSLPAVATELPLICKQTALLSAARIPLSE